MGYVCTLAGILVENCFGLWVLLIKYIKYVSAFIHGGLYSIQDYNKPSGPWQISHVLE